MLPKSVKILSVSKTLYGSFAFAKERKQYYCSMISITEVIIIMSGDSGSADLG